MATVADTRPGSRGPVNPLVPVPYRVVARRRETDDVVTLSIEAYRSPQPTFRAGQFTMLTAFGVGEIPVSISSVPGRDAPLDHTIRDVGPVSHALTAAPVGSVVGVRGPFGTDWGVDDLGGMDVVVVAGGIGLAPLRGAVWQLAERHPAGLSVVVGARSPGQVIFGEDLDRWRRSGARVDVTVDVADPAWRGPVGVVTSLLTGAPFDPGRSAALMCGPEVMMRFAARALTDRGMEPSLIRVSLERNMQCGIGVCGHCQLGPLIVCRDGPVLSYGGRVAGLMSERER